MVTFVGSEMGKPFKTLNELLIKASVKFANELIGPLA